MSKSNDVIESLDKALEAAALMVKPKDAGKLEKMLKEQKVFYTKADGIYTISMNSGRFMTLTDEMGIEFEDMSAKKGTRLKG